MVEAEEIMARLRGQSLLFSGLGRPLNHLAYADADIIELAAGTIDEIGFCAFLRANVKSQR